MYIVKTLASDIHPYVIGHGVKIANAMGRACVASTCRCVTGITAI